MADFLHAGADAAEGNYSGAAEDAAVGVADHFIPGVGAAVSAYKTVDDAVNGDWSGAAENAAWTGVGLMM
eukprot:CAMPEP_0206132674 /NCGR_PEP_ID=MMETSP1472-20131121/50298_1 /ASSEMBLY_ACC=CAM_ASM_001108 /TAXON_ID=41880 /ORGANISM="Pycnococcus provasolii, Strain RCC251" /LENGTH=69 /DNA_ID=CAMNT_0053524189 /DNA_START=47 /DNA_END=256 /DNA_ORIENTATION=-